MENLFAATYLFLLDARADPVNPLPWGALVVLLAIVAVLAVSFAASLVFLLIWFKRRKLDSAQQPKPMPHIQ